MNATVTGWGKALPPSILTNSDLESIMDTSDEWITSRSGIKERRISHVETSDMAAIAAHRALAAAGLDPLDIDLIHIVDRAGDGGRAGQRIRRRWCGPRRARGGGQQRQQDRMQDVGPIPHVKTPGRPGALGGKGRAGRYCRSSVRFV